MGDRAVVDLEPGVNILAYYNRQQGTELRARRVDEGHPGGQDLRVRLGYGRNRAQASRAEKLERAAGPDGDLVTDRERILENRKQRQARTMHVRSIVLYDSHKNIVSGGEAVRESTTEHNPQYPIDGPLSCLSNGTVTADVGGPGSYRA